MQDKVTPANPIENESLEDDTEHTDVESTAREIITPLSHKVPVWKHFGFRRDSKTGKLLVENKAACKLCFAKVAHSGSTTNLQNHLHSHHRKKYNLIFGDRLTYND